MHTVRLAAPHGRLIIVHHGIRLDIKNGSIGTWKPQASATIDEKLLVMFGSELHPVIVAVPQAWLEMLPSIV